jgi:hypothetical protein
MDKYNIAVLVDAKQEYTHQLIQLLTPHIYVGIKSIYEAGREYCETTGDKHILRKFQQLLSEIPKWNTDRIDNEYARIKALTECDWIDDLITAVFVSHTKVLTAIQLKNKQKKSIELNVPTGEHFIHKCYTEVARAFWKRPYLMNHALANIEVQRNIADSEQLIKDAIHETVRRMLPVRHILKEYLGNDFNEEQLDTDDDITSQLSVNTRNNLKRLVKQEIEQTLSKLDSETVQHAHTDSTHDNGNSSTTVKEDRVEEGRDNIAHHDIELKENKSIENIIAEEFASMKDSIDTHEREPNSVETVEDGTTAHTIDTIDTDNVIMGDAPTINETNDSTRHIDLGSSTKQSVSSNRAEVTINKDDANNDSTGGATTIDEDTVSHSQQPTVSLHVEGAEDTTALENELHHIIAKNVEEGSMINRHVDYDRDSDKQSRNEELHDLFSVSHSLRSTSKSVDITSNTSKASITSVPKKSVTIPIRSAPVQKTQSFSFFDDACDHP